MNIRNSLIVFGLVMGLLILAGCTSNDQMMQGINSQMQNEYQTTANLTAFAKCITNKGAVMYGALWCSHCNHQKSLFGPAVEYINFVDCDKNSDLCTEKNIQGYPTWIINGKQYLGVQPLTRLADLTGCKLN